MQADMKMFGLVLTTLLLVTNGRLINGQLTNTSDGRPRDQLQNYTHQIIDQLKQWFQTYFDGCNKTNDQIYQKVDRLNEEIGFLSQTLVQQNKNISKLHEKIGRLTYSIKYLNQTIVQQQQNFNQKLLQQNLMARKKNKTLEQRHQCGQCSNQTMIQECRATDQLRQTLERQQVTLQQVSNGVKKLAKTSRPSLIYTIPGSHAVTALAVHNNQLFVTREWSHGQVNIYDTTTFELIRNITIPGASDSLFGLAPCPTDNCLYVSDNEFNKLYKVNLTLTTSSNIATTTSWSVADRPNGLSVNSQHNLLVTFYGGKIQEYTPNGSLIREISNSSSWLCHAVEHINGTLAVSRLNSMPDVCLMSIDGQVLRSYGNATRGSGPGKVSSPQSLAVDKDGFILVADDSNGRVIVLDPTLSEARPLILPTGPLYRPTALWLDEPNGRLYVNEGCVDSPLDHVYVFDNVLNFGAAFISDP